MQLINPNCMATAELPFKTSQVQFEVEEVPGAKSLPNEGFAIPSGAKVELTTSNRVSKALAPGTLHQQPEVGKVFHVF